MDKRVIVGLILIILLAAAGAGCFENKPPKTSTPKLKEADGSYPSETGWLASDNADSVQRVSATLPLDLNASTKITEIIVKMKFDDSDSDHSETDDGSDPDDVSITLSNGAMESEPVKGTTPTNLEVSLKPNESAEEDFMTGSWEILVNAECGAGKPATLIPRPGIIPGPLVYKDQGIAYALNIEYKYYEEEGKKDS